MMEYNDTPPAHDFNGIWTIVNHGYDMARDVIGYMINITDNNCRDGDRSYRIRIKCDTKTGVPVGISVD